MSEPRTYSRFKAGGAALLLAALGGMGLMVHARHSAERKEGLQRRTEFEAGARVRTTTARIQEGPRILNLEGESLPWASTTVYAKVSGFLREMRVDKGSPVREGQVLAVLESPETDRDAGALQADAGFKRRTAQRLAQLGRQGIASAQQVEDAESQARVAEEKAASTAVLQGYQRVTAPFSGIVTQRYADPGALLQNGGATSTAQPLLSLAQVQRLRVTFYLDQAGAPLVKAGQAVDVSPSLQPGLVRQARVSRVAGALDPRTRTLLAEADLDNRDGAFLAGGSVHVRLGIQQSGPRLVIPVEAVQVRASVSQAAVVGPGDRVRFQALELGEEAAGQIRVLKGLAPGDRVVLNPGPALKDGDKVRVAS